VITGGVEDCSRKVIRKWSGASIDLLNGVLQADKEFTALAAAEQNFVKGFLLEKNGLLAEALREYQRSLQLNPQHTLASFQKAELEKVVKLDGQ
jgi:hypothetical protein